MKRLIIAVVVLAALGVGGWYGYTRIPEDKRDTALKPTFALVYAVVATGWVLAMRGAREQESAPG